MPTSSWPQHDFLVFFEALWKREGFRNKTEVMRAAGLDPSLHTNWTNGSQPTTDTLDKLAPVLKTRATTLYIAAGRLSPSQLEESKQPPTPVLPRELQDLIDLYDQADINGKELIRQHVAFALRGLAALLTEDPPRPSPKRRRTA